MIETQTETNGAKIPPAPPIMPQALEPYPRGPRRRALPNRRPCETFKIEADGLRYFVSVGYYDQARTEPGELFLNAATKIDSGADVAVSDAAVAVSIAIQYGVPIDVLRHAMKRNSNGAARGPLGAALDRLVESMDAIPIRPDPLIERRD